MKAQRAGPEARVLGLPVLAQAADRRGRQPGRVLAEQLLERRAEVPGRQATQVEHRQHIVDLRRAPRVGRQDPRREPLALPALAVNALVVDPGRLDRDGARPDRHPALPGATVAHHQPPAVLAALIGEPLDILADLGLKRGRDHPARPFAREHIERDRDLVVLPDGEPANILHGVPSCRPSPASVLINREGTPPSSSGPSTTSGYSSSADGAPRRGPRGSPARPALQSGSPSPPPSTASGGAGPPSRHGPWSPPSP